MWIKARRDEAEDTELGIRLHAFLLIYTVTNIPAVFNSFIMIIIIFKKNIF